MGNNESLLPILREDVQVYDCPVCNVAFMGTHEDAIKAVNLPISLGVVLPVGLCFNPNGYTGDSKYDVSVVLASSFVSPEYGVSYDKHDHDYMYQVRKYDYAEIKPWPASNNFGSGKYSSSSMKMSFCDGDFSLLPPSIFESFKNYFGKVATHNGKPIELMRVCDGIEKWVVGEG